MHPFTSCLYNEIRGRTNTHSKVTLSKTARVAVHMLRALTLLMGVDEPTFSRPFESWMPAEDVSIVAMRGADILRRGGLAIDGKPPRGVLIRGDSTTALTWAVKGRVKSELAVNASIVAVMQSVKLNMPLLGTVYLPKEFNTRTEDISRRFETNLSLRELVDRNPGMAGADILDLEMGLVPPFPDTEQLLLGSAASTHFSHEQMAVFGQFLEAGSVAPGTRRPINVYMDNVVGDRDRALYLLAFAMHLYETRGWRGKKVTHFFRHLRHHFFGVVRSTAFLDHPLVGKIRDAVKMNHSEKVAKVLRKINTCLLPLTYPLLDWSRVEFWVNTFWNEDRGRGRKATYLAGSMLMDTDKRASSATGPATDALLGVITDHGLRTAQVEATVSRGGKTFTRAGAPALRSYLLRPRATEGATEELRFPGVQSIHITFLTEKMVRDKGILEPLFYGRRQERESRFMDDLLEWVHANDKLTDDDYLFTTYQRAPTPVNYPVR
ncbi:hypothetical protein B484DRAFT_407317 [Ochromonadaceae sp. CCMP2298]|nr:hypothetical protein B484DRAFT_407317 [Ochromonadaceae sp. CCMP2298]